MADPFEVRVRFTGHLRDLNASVTSSQKAASYALKFKDMDEDLHSCIIEQLEKESTTANAKANILYFIDHFLEQAKKDGHVDYVRMMQRDIIRVVDAVAPEDGSGAANVKVVLKVLHGLQQKDFLQAQTVAEIEEVLKERDAAAHDVSSPMVNGDDDDIGDQPPPLTIPRIRQNGEKGGTVPPRLDRRQIEQRIEEDRERHKRLRESIWAVTPGDDAEMWRMFEETSELGDDDHLMGEEELEELERCDQLDACTHMLANKDAAVPNGRDEL